MTLYVISIAATFANAECLHFYFVHNAVYYIQIALLLCLITMPNTVFLYSPFSVHNTVYILYCTFSVEAV